MASDVQRTSESLNRPTFYDEEMAASFKTVVMYLSGPRGRWAMDALAARDPGLKRTLETWCFIKADYGNTKMTSDTSETMNTERHQAIAIASRWLEEPYADPDGDPCVVARQFCRSQEQIQQLLEALQRFLDFQITDYFRQSEAAEIYCEMRRAGRKVIAGWKAA